MTEDEVRAIVRDELERQKHKSTEALRDQLRREVPAILTEYQQRGTL